MLNIKWKFEDSQRREEVQSSFHLNATSNDSIKRLVRIWKARNLLTGFVDVIRLYGRGHRAGNKQKIKPLITFDLWYVPMLFLMTYRVVVIIDGN